MAFAHSVDDWGRDDYLVRSISPLVRLRWSVSVGGAEHLPVRAGALLVTNSRRLSLSALYVAWSLGERTGRPVRFVGRPDVAPFGAALRRLGGLLHDHNEVRTALASGELVVMSTASSKHPRCAGAVDHELIASAVTTGVAVYPVASMSSSFSRPARAEVGAAVRLRRRRRGPLAEFELAEAVQRRLQRMLDELGGVHMGVTPSDWLGDS